ncbi:MAG: EpsI family protein [Rhodocyclaceae bacterium]|nr:EpsI family protein [Rhodocyclaceae bacterium]
MSPLLRSGLLVAALMFAASAAAVALRPTHKLADDGPKVDLEAMIPKSFADWRVDESLLIILPAPDVQAELDKIYNQTLARTYINTKGQRIMLSIAYGGDQSDALSIHRPEGCYQGQGFNIKKRDSTFLNLSFGSLPVSRLVASSGRRHEPITYWIIVGEQRATTNLDMKKIKLAYALKGEIPDGILVRVSSIDTDEARAFSIHREFIDAIAHALPATERWRVVGVN